MGGCVPRLIGGARTGVGRTDVLDKLNHEVHETHEKELTLARE